MGAVVKVAKATLAGIGRRFGVGRSAKNQTEGVGLLVGKRRGQRCRVTRLRGVYCGTAPWMDN